MNKEEFITRVMRLAAYDYKECQLEEALNIDCENLLSHIISELGETLIVAVNPNLEGLAEDYFYETFWNNLGEADEDDWGVFYDLLVKGAADPEYIERYS